MKKVRVLLIDDDAYIYLLVAEIVRNLGWEYVGDAMDGEHGLEQFHRLKPDLVLLDINMPRMSGELALKKIIASNPDAFVIMLTSHSTLDVVHECLKNGAKGCILKSSKTENIGELIKNVWDNDQKYKNTTINVLHAPWNNP